MKKKTIILAAFSMLTVAGATIAATQKDTILTTLANVAKAKPAHAFHLGFKDIKGNSKYFSEPCTFQQVYNCGGTVQSVWTGPQYPGDDAALMFGNATKANTGNYHLVDPVLPESYRLTVTFLLPDDTVCKKNANNVLFQKGQYDAERGEYVAFWNVNGDTGQHRLTVKYGNGSDLSVIPSYALQNHPISLNTWYKLAIEVDGTTFKIYLDDTLMVTKNDRCVPPPVANTAAAANYPLSIAGGCDYEPTTNKVTNGNYRAFCGVLGDFVIDEI